MVDLSRLRFNAASLIDSGEELSKKGKSKDTKAETARAISF
jgi:hypothetical protein